mgnify:CR=1 FL=1
MTKIKGGPPDTGGPVDIPDVLSILPLRNSVLFPGSIIPIDVGRRKSVKLVEEAIAKERPIIGILTQRDARTEDPGEGDMYSIGCAARILKVIKLAKDNFSVILQGVARIRVLGYEGSDPFLSCKVMGLPDPTSTDVELDALVMNLKDIAKRVIKLMPELPKEASALVDSVTDPGQLADLITSQLDIPVEEKQDVLETFDLKARMRKVLNFLTRQLEVLKVREKINTQVQEEMGRNQREYVLRQQLKAIKEELGELDEGGGDFEEFKTKITEAKMPPDVEKVALKQYERLKVMQPSSAEYTVTRTYLEWLVEMPWSVSTEDKIDIPEARGILNADHYDLEKVKKRILEYLAVRKLKNDKKGPILCLVGPPGVGKTSLGKSIAKAVGRKFVRISLGGVRDEAEIRGHRRTYVGALPGRIVRAISEAGTMNPVVLLDEIDKVGSDYRGDPSAALLEVLDPAQNHTFRDHYLELDLDLSDVVFLATANVIENIPSALLDRMELITLDGYTEDDKVAIARDYLLPRQAERAALTVEEVTVTESALRKIAADYTREPGVRQFERLLAKALRKATTKLAGDPAPLVIDEPDLVDYLGRPRFMPESAERTAVPGVATGLAVTGMGGDVLYIEASATDGEAGVVLTGQLGDVMKESAQIALSYVRSHAEQLGVDPSALDRKIHVHVPAGAVPKDGPSAGVTMVTALVSMATGRQVRSDVGMTGEVTLNGRVLPIGGVKQKLLAAQRAGLSTVFIPIRNEADLDDVPAEVLEALDVRPMTDVADIIAAALEPIATTNTVAA